MRADLASVARQRWRGPSVTGEVPTCVTVVVDGDVVVEVRSDLPPSDRARAPGTGRGMTGMRERVALHDGALDAGREGSAWVVRARFPLAGGAVS